MSFNGYEYEDWLLEQWGLWNRSGYRNADWRTNWSVIERDPGEGACEIGDDLAMSVNAALGLLAFDERRLLKRYYVHIDPDCNVQFVQAAVRRFAAVYESPERRIA